MRKLLFYITIFSACLHISAQTRASKQDWLKYRREVFVSLGSAHFLGDLGGRDREGTDFSPADMDLGQTRTAFGFGARYRVTKWFNAVGTFNYLLLKGDDAETFDIYRNNRNLNFKSNTFELMIRPEFGYSSTRFSGNKYSIKKTLSAKVHKRTWSVYGYTGLAIFYYNPKGKDATGHWVKLQPLHTEGQGLPGGPAQYKRVGIAIPFGVHYKTTWDKKWTLGVDLCWRKTFTDYIDDVGTSYYDPVALGNAYGPKSVEMADPSKGDITGATKPDAAGKPAQRGDIQKDAYASLQVTFGYIIKKQKKKKARLRSKF
jgi:hypothetical protein